MWGHVWQQGAQALGYKPERVPRNVTNCVDCGHCCHGCPHGNKQVRVLASQLASCYDNSVQLAS